MKKQKRERVRNLINFHEIISNINNLHEDYFKKVDEIPTLIETYENVVKILKKQGPFSQVRRVRAEDANCIIRVFELINSEDGILLTSLYGAICYTKEVRTWINSNNEPYIPGKCRVEGYECNYFDVYVRIV